MMPTSRAVIVAATLLLAGTVFAQRADRATSTGIMTDPSGNTRPGSQVQIKSQDTGVETVLAFDPASRAR
jgi:hypothetical protein